MLFPLSRMGPGQVLASASEAIEQRRSIPLVTAAVNEAITSSGGVIPPRNESRTPPPPVVAVV